MKEQWDLLDDALQTALLDALLPHLLQAPGPSPDQQRFVATSLWALGSMGLQWAHPPCGPMTPRLSEAVCGALLRALQPPAQVSGLTLASLCFSLGRHKGPSLGPQVLGALRAALELQGPSLGPEELAACLYGLGKAGRAADLTLYEADLTPRAGS